MSGAANAREVAETHVELPPEGRHFHALDHDDRQFISRYQAYRRQLRFVSDDESSRCDTYVLSPSMVMTVVDVAAVECFESSLCGQDIVEFHYRIGGTMELSGSWGECRLADPSLLMWYQAKGCDDARERLGGTGRGSQRETWVSLYTDRTWLTQLFHGPSAHLAGILGESADADAGAPPLFHMQPQLGATIPILRDILRADRTNPLHWLYSSAKAFELLYTTLHSASTFAVPRADERVRLSSRDRRALFMVRDILAAEFVSPPSITILARRAGLNTSKLCAGFRALFAETTSDFVRRQRLELAHRLLTTTDLQVRQIASQAGYAHHGSFTTAFTAQFGYAPKTLRSAPVSSPTI